MKKIAIKAFHFSYHTLCCLLPLQKNRIIFESSVGNNYSGSPRAIYEYMLKNNLAKDYQIYFVFKHPEAIQLPGPAKKLKRKSIPYLLAFARAKIWVSDTRMPLYLIKRKDVCYIQTWHGTPLKKLALDLTSLDMGGSVNLEKYKENFQKNTAMWDYLVSQNPYSSQIFRRCFAFDKNMLECGYPRCDVLFEKNTPEQILALKKELGLPTDKKILLYAPTWRDNDYQEKGKYNYQPELDPALLQKALGEDTILIVKYHYLVASDYDWSPYEGFVYNFSQADDISPLYLVSDALITDYSSVMFDYAILNRPMFFFCYDLENYRDTLRGFYFDFEKEAPGPIVKTSQELLSVLIESRENPNPVYSQKLAAFREKFTSFEDGHACERITSLIQEYCNSF